MNKTLNISAMYTATVSSYVRYSVDVDVVLEHFGVSDLADIPAQDLQAFLSTCVEDYVYAEECDDDDTPDHVKQFVESGEVFNEVIRDDVYRNFPEVTLDLATVEYELEL